ncbi:unnamed protein product, partial [Mycena citricolor]
RWNPYMENPLFLTQSAILHAQFHHIQIHIHRIFIVYSGHQSSSQMSLNSSASLAICANSARACTHIMAAAINRGSKFHSHIL